MLDPTITRRSFIRTGATTSAAMAAIAAAPGMSLAAEDAAETAPAMPSTTGTASTLPVPGNGIEFHAPEDGPVAFEAEPITDDKIAEELDVDVVVCGAGMSGVHAALSCAENGLSTVLLEKGGVVAARGTGLGGFGDRVHAAAGVEVDPEAFMNDVLKMAHFRCDRSIVKTYVDRCGEALEWGMDAVGDACGEFYVVGDNAVFAGVTTWCSDVRVEKGIFSYVSAIEEAAEAAGADVRFNTPAVQLVSEDGKVTGVIAKTEDGDYIKFNTAKGVVLATGGYEHNWQMIVDRCRPRDRATYAWANPTFTNTGDGILMGIAVGALEDDYPHCLMNDPGGALSGIRATPTMLSFLRVNQNGERFVNENVSFELMCNASMYQPGGHCYVIMSGDLRECIETAKGGAPWPTDDMIAQLDGVLIEGETIEDLAEKCGIDAVNLRATIERYNELCELGEDVDFGKKASELIPLGTDGPFYAVQESGTLMTTVNGLRTDRHSCVLDYDLKPIPGLYALGNSSGSMFFGTYPHSTSAISHGRCITFGYLLGRRLAGIEE